MIKKAELDGIIEGIVESIKKSEKFQKSLTDLFEIVNSFLETIRKMGVTVENSEIIDILVESAKDQFKEDNMEDMIEEIINKSKSLEKDFYEELGIKEPLSKVQMKYMSTKIRDGLVQAQMDKLIEHLKEQG